MSDDRLMSLEIKIAFLEKTVGDLDAVVREMSDAVEVIKRELSRLRELEEREPLGPAEKPPHY